MYGTVVWVIDGERLFHIRIVAKGDLFWLHKHKPFARRDFLASHLVLLSFVYNLQHASS